MFKLDDFIGYEKLADTFGKECYLKSSVEATHLKRFPKISERNKIVQKIIHGEILNAIDLINDVDIDILTSSKVVHFHLKLQWLVELIRKGNVMEAVSYAQNHLYSLAENDVDLLSELQDVMILILFVKSIPSSKKNKKIHTKQQSNKVDVQHIFPNLPKRCQPVLSIEKRIHLSFEVNKCLLYNFLSLNESDNRKKTKAILEFDHLPNLLKLCKISKTMEVDKNILYK